MTRPAINERFMAKVAVTAETGCWEWKGRRQRQGYGVFDVPHEKGRRASMPRPAHRVAYELFVGPIPEGLALDHLCLNQACVNPAHLEPVTAEENSRRYNAGRTHCVNGHAFTPENTSIRPDSGHRRCRTCQRQYAELHRASRRHSHQERTVGSTQLGG